MNQTLKKSHLLIRLKEENINDDSDFCLLNTSRIIPVDDSQKSKKELKEEIQYIPQNINLISNIEIKNSVISNYNIFLSNSYIPNYSNDDFIKIYKLYNNAQFLSLKKKLAKVDITNEECDNEEIFDCIGFITPLEFIFKENNEINQLLINKLKSLKNICYKWRKIKGDGNCFYRSIIFAYIENIILTNNLSKLKDIICDMYFKFKEDKLNEKLKNNNDSKNIVLCMLLIYIALSPSNEKNIDSILRAYEIYIKCFNNIPLFDYGLIYYFRYLIYKYIFQNEDKIYSNDFPVKLENLLPSEYETKDGTFLFNKFYDEYVLKLHKEAEKIIIYVTPFVLEMNLNILLFEENSKTLENMKFINVNENNTITILYRNGHYDLSYSEKFVKQYYEYLEIFEFEDIDDDNDNNNNENISDNKDSNNKIIINCENDENQKNKVFQNKNNLTKNINSSIDDKIFSEKISQNNFYKNGLNNKIIQKNANKKTIKNIIIINNINNKFNEERIKQLNQESKNLKNVSTFELINNVNIKNKDKIFIFDN